MCCRQEAVAKTTLLVSSNELCVYIIFQQLEAEEFVIIHILIQMAYLSSKNLGAKGNVRLWQERVQN
ncbi:hypothetical protein M514_00135 [Trichuris suis]|uniref:Uncharacterized protein n=1 Tax=Trichuris suis TaxID=68888 RepID=A0A085NU57_9BILA|nr:hypothetical protein M513_00135 [Trichuris suis]KFD73003.1 hypothetical protein M514_00135 [Trichuris suis]